MDWSGVPHQLATEAIELLGTEVIPLTHKELGSSTVELSRPTRCRYTM